jgi:hypothetical protein
MGRQVDDAVREAYRFRNWLALRLAPWLYLPRGGLGNAARAEQLEQALDDLAVSAYGTSKYWSSHRTLVASALRNAKDGKEPR